MRAPKVGTETYFRPFHVGYINPRLNVRPTQEAIEEAIYQEFIGQLQFAPDPDEEMEGTWHIKHPIGFIHYEETDATEEADALALEEEETA